MAGAASSIGAVSQLGKSEHAQSIYKHGKKSKTGKALGNQQQFAALLAGKHTATRNTAALTAATSTTASTAVPATGPSNAAAAAGFSASA